MNDRNTKRYRDLRSKSGAHQIPVRSTKSSVHHIPRKKLQRAELTAVAGTPVLSPPAPPVRVRVKTAVRRHLAALDARLGRVRRAYLALLAIPAFAVGALIGLVVLGWWLFPVEWTNAGLAQVRPEDQALVVEVAADVFAFDNNLDRARRVMYWDMPEGTAVCAEWRSARQTADDGRAQRLAYLALAVRGVPCGE